MIHAEVARYILLPEGQPRVSAAVSPREMLRCGGLLEEFFYRNRWVRGLDLGQGELIVLEDVGKGILLNSRY